MIRINRPLVVALLVCAIPIAAAAQNTFAKRVSLDLKAMPPAEAFKVLADAVGTKVTVDPAVTAPVDILVRNVSARTALNTICESIGCRWTTDADGIAVKPLGGPDGVRGRVSVERTRRFRVSVDHLRSVLNQPLPPEMKFENAPLATVGARLSEALKSRVTISCGDPAMQTITADFSNRTLQAAIKDLLAQSEPASGGSTPKKKAASWRVTISDLDDADATTIAVVIGVKTMKAAVKQKVDVKQKKVDVKQKKVPRNR